jgi:hypothetical protein
MMADPPGDGWNLWLDEWGMRGFDDSPTAALLQNKTLEVWRADWGNETSYWRLA